jgi:hypothetical protein
MYGIIIITWWLKAGIEEDENMSTAKQRRCEYVSAATEADPVGPKRNCNQWLAVEIVNEPTGSQ